MNLICKDRKKAVSLHLQKKISMHTDDEEEDLEFEALLDSFSQAAENDFEGFYMDSEDLFDVISYLIDTLNFELADQGFTLALKLFPDNPEFKSRYGHTIRQEDGSYRFTGNDIGSDVLTDY